ncbi:uncharacterized protein LOC134179499 isoform X2 [Corticium candelabrum]|uniref:uncharacterized protein LOC134179499 isoform X2 n=1 Tax=Corticium candelabrum TaxID=121492 RepID=UPI002E25C629|nr:uncharacterized protein LOC134179499 isoform X2 [Corticium candelabrum]
MICCIQIIMHVKKLVVQATETASHFCHHQSCLRVVSFYVDIITQTAKDVVLTAKGIGGVADAEPISKEEAVHRLIVQADALCDCVSKCNRVVYMVFITGYLAATLPTWRDDDPLRNDTLLNGSLSVCRALNFSVVSATILLLEFVCERRKDKFADSAGCVISSAQIAVETVQSLIDNSFLSHPLKQRLDDVQKLVDQSTTDLFQTVKVASGIWAPQGSNADMLLASFGVLMATVYYTIAAQCSSVLHNASLTGRDLLRHSWVVAMFREKSTDEAIEFVSKSLTMVDEVMSDEEARVENATVDCELNDTSGFGSAEHYTDIMAMTVAHLGRNNEDSRDRRSIDVLVASNASMLDGDERDNEFLDEADDDTINDKLKKSRGSFCKHGPQATSHHPSQELILKTNSKSEMTEDITESKEQSSRASHMNSKPVSEYKESQASGSLRSQRAALFDLVDQTARSVVDESRKASQFSPLANEPKLIKGSADREQPERDIVRCKSVDNVVTGNEAFQQKAIGAIDPVKQQVLEAGYIKTRGNQTPSQVGQQATDTRFLFNSLTQEKHASHIDRRLKKSLLVHTSRMSQTLAVENVDSEYEGAEMMRQSCIVNKAICKVMEGLLFSVTQKALSLESACQNNFQHHYQSIIRLISDAARQMTEEVSGMEVALVASEDRELRDNIHRQTTPILLAIREADAAAAMASGKWASTTSVSDLLSSVHHVKGLCFQMVSAALKATAAYSQMVESLATTHRKGYERSKQTALQSVSARATPTTAFVLHDGGRGSRRSKTSPVSRILFEEKDDDGLVFMDKPGVKDGYASLRCVKGDTPVVKGGTFPHLIQRLTYHKIVDTDYTDCFLLTFHSFTTPHELMDALIVCYNIDPPEGLTVEEENQLYAEVVVPIRLRVCNVLRTWVSKQCDDFLDKELAERLEKFIVIISRSLPSCAKQLRSAIKRGPEFPRSRLSTKAQMPRRVPSEAINSFNILGVDSLELARQVTIIDWNIFEKIRPQECMGCFWQCAKRHQLAPNIATLIDSANTLSLWVIGTIVIANSPELRGQYIAHFIKTAKKCYKLKNYNAMFTIIAALKSGPVYRLEASWEHVAKATKSTFGQLYRLMDGEDNYATYRQELNLIIQQPAVPFLGAYLNDLALIEESFSDFLPGQPQFINFHKRRLYARTIRQIRQHQQVAYNLTEVTTVLDFLKCLEPPGLLSTLFLNSACSALACIT